MGRILPQLYPFHSCFQFSVTEALTLKNKGVSVGAKTNGSNLQSHRRKWSCHQTIEASSVYSSLLIPMSNKSLIMYRPDFCVCLTEVAALLGAFHLGLATVWLNGLGHFFHFSVKLHLKLPFSSKLFSHNSTPRTFLLFGVVIHGLPMPHASSLTSSSPPTVSAAQCLAWPLTSPTL